MSSRWIRVAWALALLPVLGWARTPIPLDLAFNPIQLAYDDKVSISRDGRRIAYTISKRPAVSPTRMGRVMPNGSIADSVGRSVVTADGSGGLAKKIAPEGSNSWRPSVSPDGSKVAFFCDANGIPQLWLYEVSAGRSRLLNDAQVKPSLWTGDEPIWSSDGERLFVPLAPPAGMHIEPTAKRPGPAEGVPDVNVYRTGRETKAVAVAQETPDWHPRLTREQNSALGVVTVSTGALRQVVPADAAPPPAVMKVASSGKWLGYSSPYKTKSFTWAVSWDVGVAKVDDGRIAHHIKDAVAFAWHPTRDQLFWLAHKQLWTMDLDSTAGPQRLGAELGEIANAPLVVTRDGKAVVVGFDAIDLRETRRDPYAQKLAVIALDGGNTRTVSIPAGLVFQKIVLQRDSIAWQPQEGTLTTISRDDEHAQHVVSRLDIATGATRVLWRGSKLRLDVASEDHRTVLGTFEDLNTPRDVYRFSADMTKKQRLSVVEPRFESMQFGTLETFRVEAPQFDGSMASVTPAILLPPGAKRGDKLPAIVTVYPGRNQALQATDFAGGQPANIPASVFTTRGYAMLLSVLPLGSDAQAGQPAAQIVDVLLPQIYRAIELGYIDANRIAISGQSFGGYATGAAIMRTGLFRAAIAIAGNYDWPGSYSWMFPDGENHQGALMESGGGRMNTTPWADLQRYIDNSPYYQAHRIHTPLLLLHGDLDDICPVEDARKMYSALKRLGRTAQLAEYKNEGHSIHAWSPVNALDAGQRVLDFLEAYLR